MVKVVIILPIGDFCHVFNNEVKIVNVATSLSASRAKPTGPVNCEGLVYECSILDDLC